MRLYHIYPALLLLIGALTCGADSFRLEESRFKSADYNETVLHIGERDYYSIQVASKTGTGLVLIDRMAGVLSRDGSSGQRDGRIDGLLEKGEYKIRLNIPQGESAELKVESYSEANGVQRVENLPYIEENLLIESELKDLQKRSYWIYQEKKGTLHLEAMGRNLKDLTLWKDGQLLVDIGKRDTTYEAVNGRPMRHIELYGELEEGYYLAIMNGGPRTEWPEENNEDPLYIRRGLPYIGESNKRALTISPFGRDCFVVSQDTDYLQLSREEKIDTTLLLGSYSGSRSRFSTGKRSSISKTSDDPWCEIHNSYSSGRSLAVVQGRPGDKVELTYFKKADSYSFYRSNKYSGNFWISSLSSNNARNSLDLTPLLITYRNSKVSELKSDTIVIGSKKPLVRKINLLGANTAYLYIDKKGTYKIFEDSKAGASASYRFVLLESSTANREEYTEQVEAGEEVELVAGYYRLEMSPRKAGILHFVVLKDETIAGIFGKGGAEKSALKLLKQTPPASRYSFIWENVFIDQYTLSYSLKLNSRKDIVTGLVVRELPLDLNEPLPLTLEPGASADIQVKVSEQSKIFITGKSYSLTEGSKSYSSGNIINRGERTLKLTNSGSSIAFYTIYTERVKRIEREPPRIKELTEIFPIITADEPYYGDFKRSETKSFILRVERPSFYRVETTGRLAFSMNVRSATIISLYKSDRNGVGRNALMQSYLKPGDYLVEIKTLGRSMGRAGLILKEVEQISGGRLLPGTVSGKIVESDQALIYTLPISERGSYSLDSFGRGSSFRYRLEDEDGWPFSGTSGSGLLRTELLARTYRLYSLPAPLRTRRVTVLFKEEEAAADPGPKEYNLIPNLSRRNIWTESEERTPDIYHLKLTAPLKGELTLSKEMAVELYKGAEFIARGSGKEGLSLDLERGEYLIKVKTIEVDNNRSYNIKFSTAELMPGLARSISSFPAELTISIGEEKITDIWSYGRLDLKASLRDSNNNLIASNDDLNNNWNFFISTQLKPGRYKLRVEKIGSDSGSSRLEIKSRDMRERETQKLPLILTDELGAEVITLPVTSGSREELYHFRVDSRENIRLALYRENILLAAGLNSLYIPLKGGTDYRLNYWHDSNEPVELSLTVQTVPEERVSLSGEGRVNLNKQAVRVENKSGLSYLYTAEAGELLYSAAPEVPCYRLSGRPEITGEGRGWLVNAEASPIGELSFSPLELEEERAVSLLQAERAHSFRIEHSGEEVLLLELISQGSLTGVTIAPERSYSGDQVSWESMEVTTSASYTGIGSPGSYQGRLWNILESSDGEQVSLLLKSYPLAGSRELGAEGSATIEVDSRKAITIPLESRQPKEYSLLLAKGMILYHWEDNRCKSIVTAMKGNRSVSITAAGGSLILINNGKSSALARIERTGSVDEESGQVASGKSYEALSQSPGEVIFEIKADRKSPLLCAAGEIEEIILLGDDGRYHYPEWDSKRGCYILSSSAGRLKIKQGRGFIKVWLTSREMIDHDFVESRKRGRGKELSNGSAPLSGSDELWSITMEEAGYITIESESPGITALYSDDRILATASGSRGRRLFYYLNAGSYKILTRPFRGAGQEGSLRVKRIIPLEISGESDERRFIAPGEIQAFRFNLPQDNKIGVGLKTESDSLRAALFDDKFNLIKEGALIITTLKAGSYLLVVMAGEEPVQYSPLLLGLEGSRMEIPEDVVKRYKGE